MRYLPFFLLVSFSCVAPRDSGRVAVGKDRNDAPKAPQGEPVASIPRASSTAVDVDEDVANTIIGRATKVVLDSALFCPAKNEKLVVITPIFGWDIADVRMAHIMAWFKYECSDEHIVVNYYSFPKNEKLSNVGLEVADEDSAWRHFMGWRVFDSLLGKIIEQGRLTNLSYIRTLKIPLPSVLKTDEWIHKMWRMHRPSLLETKHPDDDRVVWLTFDGPGSQVWGIKTADMEAIRNTKNYVGPTHDEMKATWDSIVNAILKHETPANWGGR
jgi:hypothetical protein